MPEPSACASCRRGGTRRCRAAPLARRACATRTLSPFRTTFSPRGRVAVVTPFGELDIATGPALVAALEVAAHVRVVVVDLQDVTFMDCSTVRLLLRADALGPGRVVVINPDRSVRRLLRLLGLTTTLAPHARW